MNKLTPKQWASAVALALAAVLPAQARDAAPDKDTARELERARAQVEQAREELRRATRDLARSMAKVERDTPRGEYFNFIANPKRAVLGIIIDDERLDGEERGVKILAVTPGSGAEKAGLRAGDLITAINGKPLMTDGKLRPQKKMREAMRELEAGDEAKLDYEREGKPDSASVVTQAPEPDLALSLGPMPAWAELPDLQDMEEIGKLPQLAHMLQFRGPAIRGLELARLDEDLGYYFKTNEGVLVVKAPRSGGLTLKSGDVIQKIDGDAVSEPVTVLDKLRSRHAEQDVKLEVLRQGRKLLIESKIPVAGAERRLDRRKRVKVVVDEDDAGN